MYKKISVILATLFFSTFTRATDLNLSTTPLFLGGQKAPLVMLVMGRDHTLYYEAYNDATDLDGNGRIDEYELRYAPKTDSEYYGIFDSKLCYTYSSDLFTPAAKANADKSCDGTKWSGDFLNYLTTARIDAIRRVLYGGQRAVDEENNTILQRTVLPHDAHSWGKVYTNDMATAENYPFDITKYSPLASPANDEQIFFANTSLSDGLPKLRIAKIAKSLTINNTTYTVKIWNWLSRESPVADNNIRFNDNVEYGLTITDYIVKVKSCISVGVDSYHSSECQLYGTSYKPVGLLQKYQDNMKFGLITGSFANNLAGGVLRKKMSWLSDEINNTNGTFVSAVTGIIGNINKLKIAEFDYSSRQYNSNCTWYTRSTLSNGQCRDWGSPLAEMLYESLRYFSGLLAPTSAYNANASTSDDTLGLTKVAAWDDPFAASDVGTCSKPVDLIINSLTPNFDSDQIPGANANFKDTNYTDAGTINGNNFSATTSTDTISTNEGINNHRYFIGDDGSTTEKNAPTAKTVTTLSAVRGLSPENPGQQGSFYSAGVAYFGHTHDLSATQAHDQKLMSHVVALSSPLPQIKIKVGNNTVTLVPMAKSVAGGNPTVQGDENLFQPTDQIVDYYVEQLTDTSGSFLINFEDVEQGADHDMDLIVRYSYTVSNNTVQVTTAYVYAAGGITQHAGYVISGTDNDGLYLDVGDEVAGTYTNTYDRRGRLTGSTSNDYEYYLDTPDNNSYLSRKVSGSHTAMTKGPVTRSFLASGTAANFLPSPLWYAAKWGGFTDLANGTANIPDTTGEWSTETAGQPDNYYPITNMSKLPEQLGKAFANIAKGSKTTTALAYSNPIITTATTTLAFKTSFNSENWTGDLAAYSIDSAGALSANAVWRAATVLDAQSAADRKIFTYNGTNKVNFTAPADLSGSTSGLSATQITALLDAANLNSGDDTTKVTNVTKIVNYLRGDNTNEGTVAGKFRARSHRLGDIVDSTPVSGKSITDSRPFVIVGANDGMVHIFDASTSGDDKGKEIFAYMPSSVISHSVSHPGVGSLTSLSYAHQFYVNGGISLATVGSGDSKKLIAIGTLGQGGQTVYALDLTNLTTGENISAANRVLWEFTSPELGYTGAAPSIVTLPDDDGTKAVVFGNGYNNTQADGSASATGNASVFVVNALTGALIQRLDVGAQTDPLSKGRANAMAQPAVLADETTRKAKSIYAGDLFGNVWKWNYDTAQASGAKWQPAITAAAKPSPLFIAKYTQGTGESAKVIYQPITTKPSLTKHATQAGVMVLFGTGKYIESTDSAYDDVTNSLFNIQSFYGLWDDGSATTTISKDALKRRVITAEIKIGSNYKRLVDTSSNGTTQPTDIDWATQKGWYLNLDNSEAEILGGATAASNNGERSVTNSSVVFQQLAFTTIIPSSDPCTGTNAGWIMELNATTGKLFVPLSARVDVSQENTISYLTSLKSSDGVFTAPGKVYSKEDGTIKVISQVNKSDGSTTTLNTKEIASQQEAWKKLY